jgi:hypothetical protein
VQEFFDIVELVKLRHIVQPDLYPWRVETLQRDLSKPMSERMTLLLGSVLWCGYTLFESEPVTPPVPPPIRRAKREIDLSKCYRQGGERQFDRDWSPSLQKSLTLAHDVNRGLIRATNGLQRDLMNLKLRNSVIVAIVTGAITTSPHWLPAVGDWFESVARYIGLI